MNGLTEPWRQVYALDIEGWCSVIPARSRRKKKHHMRARRLREQRAARPS